MDNLAKLRDCESRLSRLVSYNQERADWYDAKKRIENLDISLPRAIMPQIRPILGWPALVVDSLEERLNIQSVEYHGAGVGVADAVKKIWESNALAVRYSQAHLEALIHGVAFLALVPNATTRAGTPQITIESPLTMTGKLDPLSGLLEYAAAFRYDSDSTARPAISAVLYTPSEIVEYVKNGNRWAPILETVHDLGRVPVRGLINRPRAARPWGSSEITPSIISATQTAARTLARAEISSEFYSAPQRAILGMSKEELGEDAMNTYLGSMLVIPDDDLGARPSLHEFAAQSPAPFIELVKLQACIVAGEAALPPSYLGFETANPSSADQIRAIEARLVQRAERRQNIFTPAWSGILADALALMGIESESEKISLTWKDPATPTRAATADAIAKQVGSGILPPTSPITYQALGYTPEQIERLVADARIEQIMQNRPTPLTVSTPEAFSFDE